MSTSQSRNEFIDLLRGTAVLLMVLGHCVQFGSGNEYLQNHLFYQNFVFKFIYTFHMPLFMTISGYLFYSTIERNSITGGDIRLLVKKKFRSLILPIITFSILSEIFHIVNGKHNYAQEVVKDFILSLKSRFWFLWAVFLACLLVLVINQLFCDNVVAYILSFVVSFFIPESWGLSIILFVYPYFLLGYWFRKYNWNLRLKNTPIFFPLLLVVYIICFICYDEQTYVYVGGLSLLTANWKEVLLQDVVRIVIGCSGVYLWSKLVSKLNLVLPIFLKEIIAVIGRNSIGVYIISTYLNSYVLVNLTTNIHTNNLIIALIEMLGMTAISMMIVKMIEHSNMLNYLLFGRKNQTVKRK